MVPEESNGEHWWPSSHWSPTVMCQDPTQLTALIGAASDMPNIPWSGSRAALRNVTHYKPQAEVSSVGMIICSPCCRQSTLRSELCLLPYPAHQGLVCLSFGAVPGGERCGLHSHRAGVFPSCGSSSTGRSGVLLHLFLVLHHLDSAKTNVGPGNHPDLLAGMDLPTQQTQARAVLLQVGIKPQRVFADGMHPVSTYCLPLVLGIWLCISKAVPVVGVSCTLTATHRPPDCDSGFEPSAEQIPFLGWY